MLGWSASLNFVSTNLSFLGLKSSVFSKLMSWYADQFVKIAKLNNYSPYK